MGEGCVCCCCCCPLFRGLVPTLFSGHKGACTPLNYGQKRSCNHLQVIYNLVMCAVEQRGGIWTGTCPMPDMCLVSRRGLVSSQSHMLDAAAASSRGGKLSSTPFWHVYMQEEQTGVSSACARANNKQMRANGTCTTLGTDNLACLFVS